MFRCKTPELRVQWEIQGSCVREHMGCLGGRREMEEHPRKALFRSWRHRESEPTGQMQTCILKGGVLLMTRGVTFINHSLDRQRKLKAGACSVLVHLLNKEMWSLYTLSGPKLCSEHPEIRLPGSREK